MGIFDTTMPSASDMAGGGRAAVGNILANTQQTMQATQNLKAQEAGLSADSASKARKLAGEQWYGLNADKWTKTNAKGEPEVDFPVLMGFASSAGYADMASKLMEPFMDSVKKSIANSSDQLTLNTNIQKASTQTGSMMAQAAKAARMSGGDGEAEYKHQYDRMMQIVGPQVMANIPKDYKDANLNGMIAAGISEQDLVKMQNDTTNTRTAQTQAETARLSQVMSAGEINALGTKITKDAGFDQEASNGLAGFELDKGFRGFAEVRKEAYISGNRPLKSAVDRIKAAGLEPDFTSGTDGLRQQLNTLAQGKNVYGQSLSQVAEAGGFKPNQRPYAPVEPAKTTVEKPKTPAGKTKDAGKTNDEGAVMMRRPDGVPTPVQTSHVPAAKARGWK